MSEMISRRDFFSNFFKHRAGRPAEKVFREIIKTEYRSHTLSQKDLKYLKAQFTKRWADCCRVKETFFKKNENWLSGNITLEQLHEQESEKSKKKKVLVNEERQNSTSRKMGRPVSPFEVASECSKRRKTKMLRDNNSSEELKYATQMKLRKEGKNKMAKLFEVASTSTSKVNEVLQNMEKEVQTPFSPTEALNIIIRMDLSKDSYVFLREANLEKNCHMYPSYEKVLEEKKKCYPTGILIEEFKAEIPLQNLLNHTANRLLTVQEAALQIFKQDLNHDLYDLELLTKYGIDGSSSQSLFSFKYDDEVHKEVCETSILSSFICPIRLSDKSSNTILWQNPAPSSTGFCRPLKLLFIKETADVVRKEVEAFKESVQQLHPTVTDNIQVHHKIIITMVDGKVCQALTHTPSAASCYICIPRTNPSSMNDLDQIEKKSVNRQALTYGLTPLHLLINTMECILHLAYRMKLKSWMAKGPEKQKTLKEEQKRIQKELKKEMGLNVDMPAQGTGTTNNGNTARKFFANPQVVSNITGVSSDLIYRISVLLRALNSGHDINSAKYNEYAKMTAKQFVDLYPWFYMPVSLHKMLMHGAQIIEELCVPVGHASEEGMEATHKILRNARQWHTHKTSRSRSNSDLLNWLLVHSDPVIAGQRKHKKNRNQGPFPSDVIDLLKPAET